MYKFVVIYRRVEDEGALENFFAHTHLPLTEGLVGVIKTEVSRIQGKPGGASRFHLMVESYFASPEAYQKAMASEDGKALILALMPWYEGKLLTWFYAQAFENEGQ